MEITSKSEDSVPQPVTSDSKEGAVSETYNFSSPNAAKCPPQNALSISPNNLNDSVLICFFVLFFTALLFSLPK